MRMRLLTIGVLATTLLAGHARADIMHWFWEVEVNGQAVDATQPVVVGAGDQVDIELWAEFDPHRYGFAVGDFAISTGNSFFEVASEVNIDPFDGYGPADSLGGWGYDGTVADADGNGTPDTLDAIGLFQLPPAFNGIFDDANPIKLYRIGWTLDATPSSEVYLTRAPWLDGWYQTGIFGDPWGDVMDYENDEEVLVLIPAPAGIILLIAAACGTASRRRLRCRCVAIGTVTVASAMASGQCIDCSSPIHNLSCNYGITDVGFSRQWYIEAARACEVWADPLLGQTGVGVTVGIVDMGVLETHEDLDAQFDWPCSEPVPDPINSFWEDLHGTGMAGIVAAEANNPIGGMPCNTVGIAFGAKLAEVFLGDGFWPPPPSEADHIRVIGFGNDCIDVKVHAYDLLGESVSYTPITPGIRAALENAVTNGRSGLGQVFVWSAGNGGNGERTDYEELVSSRYNISVGAITEAYLIWHKSDTGSSVFCSAPGIEMLAPSRRVGPPPYIQQFTCADGTSFSAPVVAGVVALMMEANTNLSWRDVQDAIARTAATIDPTSGWQTNQAGIDHSYEYGHGLIDAYEAVSFVTGINGYPAWQPLLGERQMIETLAPNAVQIGPGQTHEIVIPVTANMRLEHVELLMNVTTISHTEKPPGIGPLEIEIERIWPPQQGDRYGG